MSAQKCVRCSKSAYPLESVQAGDDRWHKMCFKCPGKDGKCNTQLNVKTFHKRDGQAYCENCGNARFDKNAQAADTMDVQLTKDRPKVAVVNDQFRGAPELIGQKTKVGVDSMAVENALKSPRTGTVNEQFRGELVGQKTQVGMDAISIDRSVNAPKLETVSEQIRGKDAEQQTNTQIIF